MPGYISSVITRVSSGDWFFFLLKMKACLLGMRVRQKINSKVMKISLYSWTVACHQWDSGLGLRGGAVGSYVHICCCPEHVLRCVIFHIVKLWFFLISEPEKPVGLLWRLSSGIASTSKNAVTGTVGLGVSGVKWVAGKSYNAGSAVVSTTISGTKAVASKVPVSVPFTKKKDKKE